MIDVAYQVLESIVVGRVVVLGQGRLPAEDIDHSHLFWDVHVEIRVSFGNILIET